MIELNAGYKHIEYISKCCGAEVKVGGEGSTHYFICTKCENPCDAKEKSEPVNSSSK